MSPRRVAIRLDLLDNLVFSERAASTGPHRSLVHVPGGSLLGAMAQRLYPTLQARDLAFLAFHSGRLRFGNGVPLQASGAPAWPIPLSLHRIKGTGDGSTRLDNGIENRVIPHDEQDGSEHQWERVGDGYVTAQLERVRPKRLYVMRTAIDAARGRAQDQQLFGYEALAEGQSFLASIDADEPAVPALDAILASLRAEPILRLGRSRNAEYGRVCVSVLDDAPIDPPPRTNTDGRLRLWALSDVCLIDEFGRPAQGPCPAMLGFPHAMIDWHRTFIRARRYAPFNAAWGYRGLERLVICQGSVITLHGQGIDDATARAALSAGIGEFREAGLGRVAVDPRILTDGAPENAANETVAMPPISVPALPSASAFVAWLQRKHENTAGAADRAKTVSDNLDDLTRQYDAAAQWAGVACGPGPAQWNAVRDAAEHLASDAERLRKRLFEDEPAIAKDNDEAWRTRFGVDEDDAVQTFRGWLQRLVDRLENRPDGLGRLLPDIAKHAAELARRRLQQ
jgi:CRISPR-associated protein Csx10